MFQIEVIAPNGVRHAFSIEEEGVIGKQRDNSIPLDSWRIAKEHARVFQTHSGIFLEDYGAFLGVHVNGKRIEAIHGPLEITDIIQIGGFTLRLLEKTVEETAEKNALRLNTKKQTSEKLVASTTPSRRQATQTIEKNLSSTTAALARESAHSSPDSHSTPQRELEFEWRQRLHQQLLETMDLHRHDIHGLSDNELKIQTEALIQTLLTQLDHEIPASLDRTLLCNKC
jgi:pilus assembly protein CpaF